MKIATLALLVCSAAFGQGTPPPVLAPGVIVFTNQSTISIRAGTLRCTISTIDSGSHMSIYCYSGTLLVANSSVTLMPEMTTSDLGLQWSFSYRADNIKTVFFRPELNQVVWRVTANGTAMEGVFPPPVQLVKPVPAPVGGE